MAEGKTDVFERSRVGRQPCTMRVFRILAERRHGPRSSGETPLHRRTAMSKARASRVIAALFLVALPRPSRAAEVVATDPLQQFSASIEALVARVSPSVVQVLVTGYGPV